MPAIKTRLPANGPGNAKLTKLLGASRPAWDELIASVETHHAPVTCEWHFTAKTGMWHVRLKRHARTILYLLPREKHFLTAFVFGERACAAILGGEFPAAIVNALREAHAFPEGRGIRIVTRTRRDLPPLLQLAAIKLM